MSTWSVVAASHAALAVGSGTDALHAVTSGAVGGVAASAVLACVYYVGKVAPGGAVRARLSGVANWRNRASRQTRSTRDYFAEWAGARADTAVRDRDTSMDELMDQDAGDLVAAGFIPAPVAAMNGQQDSASYAAMTVPDPAPSAGEWASAAAPATWAAAAQPDFADGSVQSEWATVAPQASGWGPADQLDPWASAAPSWDYAGAVQGQPAAGLGMYPADAADLPSPVPWADAGQPAAVPPGAWTVGLQDPPALADAWVMAAHAGGGLAAGGGPAMVAAEGWSMSGQAGGGPAMVPADAWTQAGGGPAMVPADAWTQAGYGGNDVSTPHSSQWASALPGPVSPEAAYDAGPQALPGTISALGDHYAAHAGWQPYAPQIGADPYALPVQDATAYEPADESRFARVEDERLASPDDDDQADRPAHRSKHRVGSSAPRHAARGAGFASRMSARLASVRS